MQKLTPEKHPTSILIILTLFAIIGPISIDIFTPSLPAITDHFNTDSATTQWSVGIFMLGFSMSMLICGPLADRLGRKRTLTGGYILYLLATFSTLQTDNIYIFIASRFAQALFGCFGTAMARTIARDYYHDKMEVKMLAYLSSCLTLAPMLAPIIGGAVQQYAGWRYNFIIMAVLGAIAILLLPLLPERHSPPPKTQKSNIFSSYTSLFTNVHYIGFTIAAGTAFAGAFVFVAGAPFVLIDQLNISPQDYGLLFAIAIACYMISASYAARLNNHFNRTVCLQLSSILLIAGAFISLVSGYLSHGQSVIGYTSGIFIYELGLGIYIPFCQARAMEHLKTNIATASGFIFFTEILLAMLISSMISLLPGAGTIPLGQVSLIAVILSLIFLLYNNKNTGKLVDTTN